MDAAPATGERPERHVAESAMLLFGAEMARSLRESLGLEAAIRQLETVGFTTGTRLVTRLMGTRFPIIAERNAMKFVCKELWVSLFRKPANRLQTDRRGNYIIQDTCFRWLEHFSPPPDGQANTELHETALLHLAFPCGIIRGALLAIGVECSVLAEISVSTLPACSFTVTLAESQQVPTSV